MARSNLELQEEVLQMLLENLEEEYFRKLWR